MSDPTTEPGLVEAIFLELVDLPREQRAQRLAQRCGGDKRLRQRIAKLLDADAENEQDGALTGPAADVGAEPVPSRVGSYVVRAVAGEGGMGAVYDAMHEPTGRRAAVKLIRAGVATAGGRERLRIEAETLGRLNDPGIAQLYDAGLAEVSWPDGSRSRRPFIAMEFVESAATILGYARAHALSARQRLKLAEQVARAVHHAHQRGVIHRDLKPGNVLIAPDGRPKIVDFGIARLLDATADGITVTGQVLGTVRYMSPEQAGGDPRLVDTRTDIYSLGAILYELLADRPMIELDSGSTLRAAVQLLNATPPRLASVNPEWRGDLDAIVHKATERDPNDRYGSALALADDLERYLDGREVSARAPTRVERLIRMVRRNKAKVAAAALVVLSLVGGIIGTSWGLIRAERQRRLAEGRFHDITRFSTDLVFDIHDDVAKLAGSQPAVDKLLDVALNSLRKLDAESSADFDVVCNVSVGYQKLGDMQGHAYNNNRGDVKSARESYLKARDLAERALGLRPNNRDGRNALAGAIMKLGDLDQERGDFASAVRQFTASQQIMEQLAREAPGEFRARFNELLNLPRLARAQMLNQDTAGAIESTDRNAALARKLALDFPDQRDARSRLADALAKLAMVEHRTGKLEAAVKNASESAAIYQRIAADDPNNIGAQAMWSNAMQDVAVLNQKFGRLDEAIAAQTSSLNIARDLFAKDAANVRTRGRLADAETLYAELIAQTQRFDEAQSIYDSAITHYRAIVDANPDDRPAFQMLLYAYGSLADMLAAQDKVPQAIERHRAVIELLRPVAAREPNNLPIVGGLAYTDGRVGSLLLHQDDPAAALPYLRESVELNEQLLSNDRLNAIMARNLAGSHVSLGDAMAALGKPDEASAEYARALDLFKSLHDRNALPSGNTIIEDLQRKLDDHADQDSPATLPVP